jgi:hypothetical protein
MRILLTIVAAITGLLSLMSLAGYAATEEKMKDERLLLNEEETLFWRRQPGASRPETDLPRVK